MEIHHLNFRAMNCEMAAWVVAAEPRAAREHLIAVRDFVQTVEEQLSRFRSQSELSRLNARSGQPVQVSPWLWDVLVWALDAANQTAGLYDPTMLDALEAAGYNRTFEEVVAVPPGSQPEPHYSHDCRPLTTDHRKHPLSVVRHTTPRHGLPQSGRRRANGLRETRSHQRSAVGSCQSFWRQIWLDPDTRSVTLPPGARLDLGGIAKGWTADRAADRLAALGPCLVDAGGDIAARGRPPGQAGWPIGVTDPRNPETDLALLVVRDRGVATSGVDYRRWTGGGMPQHHAIDPRTRRPAQTDLLTVTVAAPDATEADLHALVALLLGAQEGHRYLTRQRDVAGLLVCNNGRQLITPGLEKYLFSHA